MKQVLSKVGRKILLGFTLIITGVLLDCFCKNGLSTNMLQLLQYVGVGFFLGNGIEHVANALRRPPTVDVAPTLDISPQLDELKESLNQMDANNKIVTESLSGIQKGLQVILQLAGAPRK